jgi:hypothetical protein
MAEWEAFYSLEPWGFRADWYPFAVVAATIANAMRSRKSKAYKVEDFMPPDADARRAPQSIEEMKAALISIYDMAKRKGLAKKKPRRKRSG